MKRFFAAIVAIFFPWVTLLANDNLGGAIAALVMQTTIIGWIPASAWAWRVMNENKTKPPFSNQ